MTIKIECDQIKKIKTNYDKKIEIVIENPTIEEYEDMKISNMVDMIGLTEVNEITTNRMSNYIQEITDNELLALNLKIAKEMSDRGININEKMD